MLLRPYVRADLPALAALFSDTVHRVCARDYTQEQLDAWADGKPDLEGWQASLSRHDSLVAELHGEVVGFADMDGAGYLDRLYVHAAHQGEGIATALCNALEARARDRGVKRFTTHASITARPFFEKRGYRTLREQEVERHGVKLTNFIMEKESVPMKKKFAFLLMGAHYEPEKHQACFETGKQFSYIYTVNDFEGAKAKVLELYREGFGAIELCGAFGPEKAGELAELTHHEVAIGYVTHDSSLDGAFATFFG